MQQTQLVASLRDLADDQPAICACVCTHNGRAVLGDCLDSLAGQDMPAGRFSILVIDDGSTDGTADLFRSWRDKHPKLTTRLVCQPSSGLSAARNAGLQFSDAPIVAYIDDDAVAEPGWLSGLLAAFLEFPCAGAAAGPVSVRWTTAKPRWWRDELDEVFNRFQPAGDQPCTLRFPNLPYGCNFAVRRNLAVGLGRFRTDLGRQKGTLLGGEETELMLRMLVTDHQVVYWPSAGVQHLALPHRANRKYILRRAWMHGRSAARLAAAYPQVADAMPGLATCLWRMCRTAPQYRFRTAHWKYWLYRLGYHWEQRALGLSAAKNRARRKIASTLGVATHV